MSFLGLATKKELENEVDHSRNQRVNIWSKNRDDIKRLGDLEQKVLVLEGRINRLEGLHSKMPSRHIYDYKTWTRMSKERRQSFLAKLSREDRKRFLQKVEADKHGRKKRA